MNVCPPDCIRDRERFDRDIHELKDKSMASWVRSLLVGGVLALFSLYGVFWAYSSITYETKVDAKQKSQDNKDEFRRINDKLDRLLQRP